MQKLREYWWEPFSFLVFLGLAAYQLFLPPVTGLANNSDFVYVLGKFSICPADNEQQDKVYLVTDYFVDAVNCTWESGITSVEVPLVYIATWLSAPFTGRQNFDLRALAAIHLLLLLTAFGILLSLTRRAGPGVRYGIPILFTLIFTDIAYTGYLNSVYLDAPAMVLLLASSAVAVAACLNHRSWLVSVAYLLFSSALVFSKSQHAILGLAFAAVAVVLACRPAKRIFRIEWGVIAVLLVASTGTMLSLTPDHYKLFALYNVIFARIGPHDIAPWDVLKEVGLGDGDIKYLDTHAYTPSAPVYDDAWSKEFLRRTSFGKLIWFYLRNPDVVFSEMNRDLKEAAPVLRPTDMANYRQKDGYPPATLANRFDLWSNLRSRALEVFPYHVLLLFLAPWAYWIAGWKRQRFRSPILPLALALSAGGMVEFAMSALTDALDNSRHLFLFQVLTELMILLTAAALLDLAPQLAAREARETNAPPRRAPVSALLSSLRASAQSSAWEVLCFAVFLALVSYQLFLPPVTGLANNSDFMKVLGPWSICSDQQAQDNRSLVTDYAVDPACQYDQEVTSLQRPMTGVALALSEFFMGDKHFDLRFLAALHFAILLLAFAILLRLTRGAPKPIRYGIPPFFILIFSDIAYTGYLNSAYMDAPAFAFLVLASVIAAVACFHHQSWLVALAYFLAGAAMIFSKSQHAVLGVLFAALALFFAWQSSTRGRRIRWIAVALLLLGSMVSMLEATPSSYQLLALYSLIFARLAPHSAAPVATLQELGLNESDMRYLNTDSYTPGAGIYTALWAEDFLRRTSFGDVIVYYLRHPSVPLREMNSELRLSAPVIRPHEMPNYRQQDGIPPGTMATRFSLWSNLRSAALQGFPYHVLLIYLAPWAVAFAAWRGKHRRLQWRLLPLALTISAAGILAFPMATLTDAMDNARHLFMFHVITELMLLMIAAAILDLLKKPQVQQQSEAAARTACVRV